MAVWVVETSAQVWAAAHLDHAAVAMAVATMLVGASTMDHRRPTILAAGSRGGKRRAGVISPSFFCCHICASNGIPGSYLLASFTFLEKKNITKKKSGLTLFGHTTALDSGQFFRASLHDEDVLVQTRCKCQKSPRYDSFVVSTCAAVCAYTSPSSMPRQAQRRTRILWISPSSLYISTCVASM